MRINSQAQEETEKYNNLLIILRNFFKSVHEYSWCNKTQSLSKGRDREFGSHRVHQFPPI